LEELGFAPVLLSHRVGGLPRLLPRLHTTLVEAAVRPVLRAYLGQVQRSLGAATRLRVMTSAGVLQPPDQLLAKDTILSGPAGGLVGAVAVARSAGLAGRPIIGFDMGGTSTDVFHAGAGAPAAGGEGHLGLELNPETSVAGLRLQAPTLPIHTVAAGGGSVVRLEGGRLQVGPLSAGADPGPACYRRGGPLTITDANLLLGRLPEGALPEVFGPGGDQPPDAAIVRSCFEALAAELAGQIDGSHAQESLDGCGGQSALLPARESVQSAVDRPVGLAGRVDPPAMVKTRAAVPPEGPGSMGLTGAKPGPFSGAEPEARAGAPALLSPEALAQGARSIALERMADAIRRISIQRGHDIRSAVLVSYGGAGGQHACALAERLGVAQVLLHPLAGVLSAYGLGLSRQQVLRSAVVQRPLAAELLPQLVRRRDALLAEASQALEQAGDGCGDRASAQVSLELRPVGGERGLELPWRGPESLQDLRQAFETRHRQRFGYVVEGEALVVERLQVLLPAGEGGPKGLGAEGAAAGAATALRQERSGSQEGAGGSGAVAQASRPSVSSGQAPAVDLSLSAMGAGPPPEPCRWVPLCLPIEAGHPNSGGLAWRQVPCWRREALSVGQRLVGPAVVLEATGTTVLEPGWGGRVLADGALLLEPLGQEATGGGEGAASQGLRPANAQSGAGSLGRQSSTQPDPGQPVTLDPVQLELYNHRFSAIAEQMGVRLQQSSRSVNIRERLDFSCALFDGAGQLVANAPHIPVHLGSMGESVAALLAAIARGERPPLAPGDAIASNDPFSGGTHLPDITVISPVFAPGEAESAAAVAGSPDAPIPLFYVACRGHHADVGGITPGSMPPFSRSILEEGLRLDNVPLIQAGRFDLGAWRQRLAAGEFPVRDPERLLADLQAQVAANRLGEAELHRLIEQRGGSEVVAFMGHVQRNAAEAVRAVIERLRPGRHAVELDDGSRIVVAIEPDPMRRRVRVDFSGTSAQQAAKRH
jgi:5-oxoprolinase (ATP-hydrolysing)